MTNCSSLKPCLGLWLLAGAIFVTNALIVTVSNITSSVAILFISNSVNDYEKQSTKRLENIFTVFFARINV